MQPKQIAKLITENLNENNGLITEWGTDTIRQRTREIANELGIITEIDDTTIEQIRTLLTTMLGDPAAIEQSLNQEQLDNAIRQTLQPPQPKTEPAQPEIPQDPHRWTNPTKIPGGRNTAKDIHYYRKMTEE
jgi:hypothetical protein